MSSSGVDTDFYSDCEDETDSRDDDNSSSSSEDCDREELYESFKFEDDAQIAEFCSSSYTGSERFSREATSHSAALYPHAALSIMQSNLLVFQYAVRHSLTGKAFTELLQLLSVHLPNGATMPKSLYKFKRYFVEAFPQSQAVEHVYCSCCQRPLTGKSDVCHGNGCSGGDQAVFITLPVGPQFKQFMEGIYSIQYNM